MEEKKFDLNKIFLNCTAQEMQELASLACITVYPERDEKTVSKLRLFTAYLISFISKKDEYLPIVRNMLKRQEEENK